MEVQRLKRNHTLAHECIECRGTMKRRMDAQLQINEKVKRKDMATQITGGSELPGQGPSSKLALDIQDPIFSKQQIALDTSDSTNTHYGSILPDGAPIEEHRSTPLRQHIAQMITTILLITCRTNCRCRDGYLNFPPISCL